MKKIGLGIFILAFGFFISAITFGKFELSKESVQKAIPKQADFITQTEVFKLNESKTFGSQFSFVDIITPMADEANQLILSESGIKPEDVTNIIYHSTIDNKVQFNQNSIDLVFDKENEEEAFKNKQLTDNLSWLFGEEIASIEDLENKLSNKVSEINQSILRSKGFDLDYLTDTKFQLTKASTVGFFANNKGLILFLTIILGLIGALIYILPELKKYPGIKNDGVYHSSATNRGIIGIIIGTFLILFYILLYWFPQYLTNWVLMVDPLSESLSGNPASQWFLYGLLYCVAMTVMGIRMIIKYRHNKYQIVRTISVLFFQVGFAFLIPEILVRLNQPYFDFKNMWPLDYDFFFDWNINSLIASGNMGIFMLVWGILLFAVGVPVFVYFFGKRWYCSWVCGCGGLAETLGDPYRQLSNKTLKAWKLERWLIHGVLVFVVVMTGLTLYSFFSGASTVLGINTYTVQKTYGFLIGSVFSGVIGTGFYPLLGNRSWCRFGCPLAAYLGLVQKFKSRFRITTNGGQCISCGNCSTYCEMGIDVRAYAQKGQNIVRSSCVGCGVCSAVCPRGVLKLENGPTDNRVSDLPIILGNDGIAKLNDNLM
ncbi:4Fe-4S binding protein [bacterium]|nr:4Fe-4S binding protein [bacterium]|tara:strand:+ start:1177 stop:2973 length:1797 start_codon:yes stop_codon:yes gene_type:complete